MFGSEILDVAIGLIMMFLLLSLVVSSIKEAFETVLNHRAKDLERGLREMFGDVARNGLVPTFYQHPLISSLFAGDYRRGNTKNLPSYIPSRLFALTVIDLVSSKTALPFKPGEPVPTEQTVLQNFETSLANLPGGSQLRGALEPLLVVSQNNLSRLQVEIESWFNGSMDRVAGWYKRRTQIMIAAIGIGLAIFMNIDALSIVRYLNTNQTARSVLMTRVDQYRQGRLDAAAPVGNPMGAPKTTDLVDPLGWIERQGGLPLGWVVRPAPDQTPDDFNRDWRKIPNTLGGWLLKVAGLLFTAFAVSLGAPFWFDLLNRFMVIRSTVKPEEKSQEEPKKG